jgi:hypothetical protein
MKQVASLEAINAMAPYSVSYDEDNKAYLFVSDFGVKITISFEPDDLITTGESYQLVLVNVNNKKSPRDEKVKQTIYAITSQFMEEHQSALLYICETNDGKQRSRGRLFRYWTSEFDNIKKYLYLYTTITDLEGVDNAAAIIIRKDNPKLVAMVTEFAEVTDLLRSKPENESNEKKEDGIV